MKKYLALIFLFLTSFGCASLKTNHSFHQAFQEDLQEAKDLIKGNQLQQAIDELNLLLKMDSKNGKGYFLRGVAYQKLEEYSLALDDYNKSIELVPALTKSYYNKGMIYAFQLMDSKEALTNFDKVLTLSPHHSEAFSIAKIMKSLDWDEERFQKLKALSEKMKKMEDDDQKKIILEKWIQREPLSPLPYYFMGKVYENLGDNMKALSSYKKALFLWPTSFLAHESLGRLLLKMGNPQEGKIHLQKANLLDPNHSEAQLTDSLAPSKLRT
jgi:tetratricopeptide (TPR) repeat protein